MIYLKQRRKFTSGIPVLRRKFVRNYGFDEKLYLLFSRGLLKFYWYCEKTSGDGADLNSFP